MRHFSREHRGLVVSWIASLIIAIGLTLFAVVTAVRHVPMYWSPTPDPRDRAILILSGTSAVYVFEMRSDTRDADYPRTFRDHRPWRVPGLLHVSYVPPAKPPAGERGWVYDIRIAELQLWPFLMIAMLWTIVSSAKVWRRRRAWMDLSLCRSCGYDIRATPGLCPECGTTPHLRRTTDRPA